MAEEAGRRTEADRQRSYSVGPVHRAVLVLRCVGASPVPLPLRRISGMVGLPKSTVFRYLRTLSADGLIVHDAVNDLYEVDPGIVSLLPLDGTLARIREIAEPHMTDLHGRFGGVVRLGVVRAGEIICVETVGARPPAGRRAARQPIHATCLGLSILAFLDEELRSSILATAAPAVRAGLHERLAVVRAEGFAVEEGERGITLAAPVMRLADAPVAGLSMGLPAGIGQPPAGAMATALRTAAAAIAATFLFRSA